jgi:SAM-dependent methyltransferase
LFRHQTTAPRAKSEDKQQRLYESAKVIAHYAASEGLSDAESLLLGEYEADFSRRVLDIGVGTGRTVPWIAPFTQSYVGLDYSLGMVCAARRNHPERQIEYGDARNLAQFADGSFDCVLFSYNGLDSVSHADRQRVLWEVARVLTPGGLFVFSTHSLARRLQQSLWESMFAVGAPRSPMQVLKHGVRVALRLGNFVRSRHLQERHADYAVLLDPGHDFTLPIYYVASGEQVRQLEETGFRVVQMEAEQHPEFVDERFPYAHYYAARKTVG